MIKKHSMNHGSQVKVTFSLPADHPAVGVAGDFNQWDPTAMRLRKRGDVRSASVTLDSGARYAFRYVDSEGNWFDEDHVEAYEDNGFGGTNGILVL